MIFFVVQQSKKTTIKNSISVKILNWSYNILKPTVKKKKSRIFPDLHKKILNFDNSRFIKSIYIQL